jgi:murein DD-endopeptidase MepM/ murein hydrolase activator NlpD
MSRLPRPARRGRALLLAALVVVLLPGAAAPAGAVGAADPAPPPSAPWRWPVAGDHELVRPYLAPPTPYGAGHRGIDLAAPTGSTVRAPADGVVHFAGVVVDRPLVSLAHEGGVLSSFEPVEPSVREGERVEAGDEIGELVAGHCASACLHLGARLDGEYLNPLLFLGGLERSVLLPVRR